MTDMKQDTERLPTRREILGALVGAGLMPIRLRTSSADKHQPDSEPAEPVVEWNTHLFSSDATRFPMHPKAVYKRDVSKDPADPLANYLKQLDAAGVDRAVVVQPEPYGDDHSLVLDCLSRETKRLRGTSLFYPRDPDAPKKLDQLIRREPRIVSTRFHAHRGKESYLTSFADPGVRALWKQAVDLNLVIELHIGPDYARQAGQAIRAFPGCKVLIDHLAEPHLGSGVEFADVLDLAKFPNVYMKLSGLGHFAKDGPYFESALPFTCRVIGEFGADRLVWGSFPPEIVDKHMASYSETDRARVKGGNLCKLLNWRS